MALENKQYSACDEMYVYFHQADDTKGEKIMIKWGDLKKKIVEELLSSFPEKNEGAPASIDPEFLKPAPKLVGKEESDKPKNAKSTYKVEFVCLNSSKEWELKSHTCLAGSEAEAIANTKEHCKTIACEYKLAIGIWKDGLYVGSWELEEKKKEPDPFRTWLVKFSVLEKSNTRTGFSFIRHTEDFVAVASDEISAINRLLEFCEKQGYKIPRVESVGLFDHS